MFKIIGVNQMSNQQIDPEKVTKPIQLLAAWLLGLVLVNSAFLFAAVQIDTPTWVTGALVIASMLNVPIFIACLFILQTKFRPEMQEDKFYAKYLEHEYEKKQIPPVQDLKTITAQTKVISEKIYELLSSGGLKSKEKVEQVILDSQITQIAHRFGMSRTLSELYYRPELWPNLVNRWKDSHKFQNDIRALVTEGLAEIIDDDINSCKISEMGIQVAREGERIGILYPMSSRNKDFWEQEGKLLSSKPDS